jgi:hypothetical protein
VQHGCTGALPLSGCQGGLVAVVGNGDRVNRVGVSFF